MSTVNRKQERFKEQLVYLYIEYLPIMFRDSFQNTVNNTQNLKYDSWGMGVD
jgi:hypothetical protein